MPKKADFTEVFTHSIAKTAVLKITKRTARVTKADIILFFQPPIPQAFVSVS